jgi:hypothetical protein
MLLEELKKIMPDGMSDEELQQRLDVINDDAKKMVEQEVKGLKDNKTKLLDQMAKLKENQIPEGFDPDQIKDYLENKDKLEQEKKALEEKSLEEKGQWDALKLKLNETHAEQIARLQKEKDEAIAPLKSALDKELIENAAIKAIEAEKGNSFFLLPHMKDRMKTVQNEKGEFEVQILDKDGNPRLADDATTPFGVKDFVAELKANERFAPAFPTANAGSGNGPNANTGGGSGGINPWKAESKNVTEQARINKENPTLATQLKKAAGVQE